MAYNEMRLMPGSDSLCVQKVNAWEWLLPLSAQGFCFRCVFRRNLCSLFLRRHLLSSGLLFQDNIGGEIMKVVVVRSPKLFSPLLRMIFKINKAE